jgi:hypothetical protein
MKSKKIIATFAFLGGIGLVATVEAAPTASIVLQVTPVGTKSVAVSAASYDFGSLALASVNNIMASSITVTNDGTIVETLGLRISAADAAWASGAVAGADTYNLRALFNGNTVPVAGDFAANDDVVTQVAPVLATTPGAIYSGTENAGTVPPVASNTRGLWFKLNMPTSSTVSTIRSFTVEVSAN